MQFIPLARTNNAVRRLAPIILTNVSSLPSILNLILKCTNPECVGTCKVRGTKVYIYTFQSRRGALVMVANLF